MGNLYRHGEVMLVPAKQPKGKVKSVKEYVVGLSTAGHNHVLRGDFGVIENKSGVFFIIEELVTFIHTKETDRHKDLTVQPGVYERFHATEYSPFTGLIEEVRD